MVVTFLGISVVVVVLTASAYLTSAVVTRALISFFFSVMNVSGVVDVVGVVSESVVVMMGSDVGLFFL